jgi:CRISPR-associated protein Csb3
MSKLPEPTICVRVDPTNPGQLFACCGLLELADRLWRGAEGWFDREWHFLLRPTQPTEECTASTLVDRIGGCSLTNTMTDGELQRRDQLSSMSKKEREGELGLAAEKKELDTLWRESPIRLLQPFHLRLDWFMDDRAGGATFKTWAGQQSVLEIARGMKAPIEAGIWSATPPEGWLSKRVLCEGLPFNFDSDLGGLGSDRDVGFSFDPLKRIGIQVRPMLELLAFIGLQRFRPMRIGTENRYRFSSWLDPLVPEVAAGAACGLVDLPSLRTFEFRLLYRTKYLKSFLPGRPIGGNE